MNGGRLARLVLLSVLGFVALSFVGPVERAGAAGPTDPAAAPGGRAGPAPGASAKQGSASGLGLGNSGPNDRRPLDIQADDGIEWQQDNFVYIAHGNARATRGNATVYADTLTAHYRPAPTAAKESGSKTKGDGGSASAGSASTGSASTGGASTGSTDIYRVDADGHVRLQTETQTVYGDHAVYDLDQATAVVTGEHLRLVTPRDTVTARDTLEWYDNTQVAVARGDALAIQEQKRLAGDVLTAQVVKPPDGPSRISRVDAQGHVLASTSNEIARGASGVYNVDTGIVTLAGGVTITRDGNELKGQYGVVDLNRNISRLLSAPPGAAESGPVQGLIVPRSSAKPGASNQGSRPKQPAQQPSGTSP
jgi:lipopolysaccharide export system protein LptA